MAQQAAVELSRAGRMRRAVAPTRADAIRYRAGLWLLLAPFLLGIAVLVGLPALLTVRPRLHRLRRPVAAGLARPRATSPSSPRIGCSGSRVRNSLPVRAAGGAAARAGGAGAGAAAVAAPPRRRPLPRRRVPADRDPRRRLRADLAVDLQPALRAAEPGAGRARAAAAGLAGRRGHGAAGHRDHVRCSRSARASSCCSPGCSRCPSDCYDAGVARRRRPLAAVPPHHPAAAGAVAAAADRPRHHRQRPEHLHAGAPDDRRRPLLRHAVRAAADLRGGVRPLPLRRGRGDDAGPLCRPSACCSSSCTAPSGAGIHDGEV